MAHPRVDPPPEPHHARGRLRWGWKTAHVILRREGHTVNRKRTRRLWRDEGLRRPAPCRRKRSRPRGGGELLRAERPNHVWALDFQFDETADRRRLRLLNVVEETTFSLFDDRSADRRGLTTDRGQRRSTGPGPALRSNPRSGFLARLGGLATEITVLSDIPDASGHGRRPQWPTAGGVTASGHRIGHRSFSSAFVICRAVSSLE